MGAEQSALLVCTQTGKPERPLRLQNAEQFFQLYFDKMPEPKTGPVTEALLHLIMHAPQQSLESREQQASWASQQEPDSGYENDELETEETSEEEQDIDMVSEEEIIDQLSDSDMSIESSSTIYNMRNNDDSDFELIPLEFVDLQPIDLLNIDDPQLEFEQEFIIRVADLNEE
ncbi:uncharacterized protein [Drosophila virilis]|uniref:Uncharacterized protein n=1 Tax=Drosophila virilis TaxID=7244 RepID=B4M8S4_DROVI|nr:uncharacterized protein LOC6634160 [Drosophila virilis]EDW57600.2 uncharacterized protein Dvir_GJ18182 [Drosophila virilis]